MAALFYLICLIKMPGSLQANERPNICLSAEEKTLFEQMMAYREKKHLPRIPLSSSLTKVAQAHVHDLQQYFDFSHAGSCNPHSWSKHGPWKACCYSNDHSNKECMWNKPREITGYASKGYEIAYFQSDGVMAFAALEGWKHSKGHNAVILNRGIWKSVKWKAVGIGIYKNYAVAWFGALPDHETGVTECP